MVKKIKVKPVQTAKDASERILSSDQTKQRKKTGKREMVNVPDSQEGKVEKPAKAVKNKHTDKNEANSAANSTAVNQKKDLKCKKELEKNGAAVEEDNVKEAKKIKPDSRSIMAGTTIDQVVGIKLKTTLGKRARKRKNHVTILEQQKKKSKDKEQKEMIEYLEAWINNREKWKFQKLKQTYIQNHVLDEAKIDSDIWPMALQYLSRTKGSSKEVLVKSAEAVIQESDAAATRNDDKSAQESIEYQRARELLQYLG